MNDSIVDQICEMYDYIQGDAENTAEMDSMIFLLSQDYPRIVDEYQDWEVWNNVVTPDEDDNDE